MFGDKLKHLIKNKDTENDNETIEEKSKGRYSAGNNKKKIDNLVFFIVLLIITIVIINLIWNGKNPNNNDYDKTSNTTTDKKLATTETDENTSSQDLENRLENILSKIEGVGEVKVFINYSESSEVVAMYNESSQISNTEENDTSGRNTKD